MTIVVTGSSGHLGEALVKVLGRDGHDVIGVDTIASPETTVIASILDRDVLRQAIGGADAVIHAATLHKPHLGTHSAQQFVDTNISGTLAVLEEAVAAKTPVVYVSTTSTFGQTLNPPPGQPAAWITEESPCRAKNIYGATKVAAEDLCELFHRDHGLAVVVLRTSRFFPEDDDALTDAVTDDQIGSANAKVNELQHRRVDIADVVDACKRAVDKAPLVGFGRYIISATTPFIEDDTSELRADPAAVIRRLYPDAEEIYAGAGWRLPASIDRVYLNARARRDLGWEPRWDFRRALDRLAAGEEPRSRLAVEVGAKGYHDQAAGVYTTRPRDSRARLRRATWQYYDRRVDQGVRGIANAVAYWTGLGVPTTAEEVGGEAAQVEGHLRALAAAPFVEVGAGPGTFTAMLAGPGVAVDQSPAALARLKRDHPAVAVVRADATALPFRDGAFGRYFAAHLYGLLQPEDRTVMVEEAYRVASEVVILDAGRPDGVPAEEWQQRSLPDGSRYRIYRRHFYPDVLAAETGGTVLFGGSFYVLTVSGPRSGTTFAPGMGIGAASSSRPFPPLLAERPQDLPVQRQVECFQEALSQNPVAEAVLALAADMALPGWCFGAGGVAQTVWNLLHGFGPAEGIKDYDLVYFDPDDLSAETERRIEQEVARRLSAFGVVVDVHNEARVHLWYEQHFGRPLDPYRSTEEAIATWPTTASAVGVRRDVDGFSVCAPFGLSDLLGMVARPNKTVVTREVYEEKVSRWAARWPKLRVIAW